MQPFQSIYESIVSLVKRIGFLPQSIAIAARQKQRQAVLNEQEAERLDRIRHPSKYLGK